MWSAREVLPREMIDLLTEGNEEESDDEIVCESSDSDESECEFVF